MNSFIVYYFYLCYSFIVIITNFINLSSAITRNRFITSQIIIRQALFFNVIVDLKIVMNYR